MRYLVSACLLGENCKYSGGNNYNETLCSYLAQHEVVPVCPEVLGGLPTPRACAEIRDGRVYNTEHEDVTEAFMQGAMQALSMAQKELVHVAILQSRSPSCGKGMRYSGNFDGTLVEGNGIFVDMLMKHDIPVIDVMEFVKKLK